MPWQGQNYAWTRQNITTYAPHASGVYFLWKPNVPIYVGETNDLQRRLLEHFDGDNACITRAAPQTFGFELIAANARMARQNTLIAEYDPLCNRKMG